MTVRWGIIGAGQIAERFARDLAFSAGGRPAVVASRNLDRAKALADHIGGMEALDDYQRLVTHEAVDAVYVATPNNLHRDHCLMAIAAGKPVLCEKPLATTAAEARDIAAAAEAAGVLCMEAMWTRYLPLIAQLREKMAAGEIGDIVQMHASLGIPWEEEPGNPITDPALGGGALLDLGVYGLSLVVHFLGAPAHVTGECLRSSSGSVRDAVILLRHDGQGGPVLTTVRASHSTILPNTFEIHGTRGTIVVGAPFFAADAARIAPVSMRRRSRLGPPNPLLAHLRNSRHWTTAKRAVHRVLGSGGRLIASPFPGSGLQFEADAFARYLADGPGDSSAALNASIAVLDMIDTVQASA